MTMCASCSVLPWSAMTKPWAVIDLDRKPDVPADAAEARGNWRDLPGLLIGAHVLQANAAKQAQSNPTTRRWVVYDRIKRRVVASADSGGPSRIEEIRR